MTSIRVFFDQVRATAERDEKMVKAAQANNFSNFSAYLGCVRNDLFVVRMGGNEQIFRGVMNDR